MGIVAADISVTRRVRRRNQRLDCWWGEEPPYHAPVFVLTPCTTMRYDRARVSLDRDASYIVATFGSAGLEGARESGSVAPGWWRGRVRSLTPSPGPS
jgi:hypothetical protein